MRRTRSAWVFRLVIATAGAILTQMFVYVLQMVFTFVDSERNLFQLCSTWFRKIGLHEAVYVLDGLAIFTIAAFVALFARQSFLVAATRKSLLRMTDAGRTEEIGRRFRIPSRAGLMVVRSDSPIAFTFGLARPTIVLSTGIIDLLEEEELASVIHHERFHQISYDPLRCFLLSVLTFVLWFLPILRWQSKYYRIAREVLADRYAITAMGSERSLGSALLKLIRCGTPPVRAAAVSFADTSVNYRMIQLLNPRDDVMPVLPRGPLLLSVPVALVIICIYGIGLF